MGAVFDSARTSLQRVDLHRVRRLRARYPGADRKSHGVSAADAAVILLDHDVPSAFVPAMAVLASTEGNQTS